ncbi:MAG: LicD family protein [Bacteroides sp.]|nr:LicD family protein [Prevotella sp.]MCM1407865.1 LicD family protein [Treponema brennaborense]MCM1469607.1 LicD family protein [Bacteroides sp.]
MQELTLQEIQQESLKVLLKLDALCRKLDIRYFLAYGTLIGAIRHNGFIPWDDDIDVMMPRKDYEILKRYMVEHSEEMKPFKICDRTNTKNYSCSLPRFVNTDFIFRTRNPGEKNFELGVFVDIYPLDNCGNSFSEGKKLGKKIRMFDKLYIIYINPDNGKKGLKSLFRRIVSAFLKIIWRKHFDFDSRVASYISKRTSDDDTFIGVLFDCDPIERSKAEQLEEHLFEGHAVYIPKEYDSILNLTHKGYMQLPPESERVPHHGYSIYRTER